MNRSMGLIDLYPFLLSPKAIEKLAFVHALTHRREDVVNKAVDSLMKAV
jgi:hypothetical protein